MPETSPKTAIDVTRTQAPAPRAPLPDVWQSFRNEMDRMFDDFTGGGWFPSMRRFMEPMAGRGLASTFELKVPAVDVGEDDKAYTITAELPGMTEKSIEVSVADGVLVLKGEKHQEKDEKTKNYHICERSYGSFQRSFRLPDGVDQDKIAASFNRGVLTVILPKTAEAQKPSKKIEVKAA